MVVRCNDNDHQEAYPSACADSSSSSSTIASTSSRKKMMMIHIYSELSILSEMMMMRMIVNISKNIIMVEDMQKRMRRAPPASPAYVRTGSDWSCGYYLPKLLLWPLYKHTQSRSSGW